MLPPPVDTASDGDEETCDPPKATARGLEVFAGEAVLTRNLRMVGFEVDVVELLVGGAEHDMSRMEVVASLHAKARLGTWNYGHFAPPCNTYSIARFPKLRTHQKKYACVMLGSASLSFLNASGLARTSDNPDGKPGLVGKDLATVRLANTITHNAFTVATALCEADIPVSIENPHGSLLWKCSDYIRWSTRFKQGINRVVLDYCCYGEDHRKRTMLITWSKCGKSFLEKLSKRCPGTSDSHTHCLLSGWRPRCNGVKSRSVTMRPTKGTAAYPMALCRCWAEAVKRHLQSDGRM